jgi:hypothetical protein
LGSWKFFAPSGFQSILIWMHICDLMVMNLGNFAPQPTAMFSCFSHHSITYLGLSLV